MRRLLSVLGIDISYEQAAPALEPVRMVLKRYQGAWYFAGAKPDTTVHARIRMPDGAPAFMDQDTAIVDGYAEEHFGKTIYNEVRFFVDMPDGTVEAQRLARPFGKRRSLRLSGLRNTTVTIYPEPEALTEGTLIVQPWANADRWDGEGGGETVPFTVDMQRQCAVVREYTGTIYVKW